MEIYNDKIVYGALMMVLHNEQYAYIAEAFRDNTDALQKLLPEFTPWQKNVIQCYVHSLADVYVAALTILTEEKISPV